jgi:hypothetical protein
LGEIESLLLRRGLTLLRRGRVLQGSSARFAFLIPASHKDEGK